MKKPKKTYRNPLAIAAKQRSGGAMSDKKDKRRSGKNKHREYLKEDYQCD
jgi:hypothetical protein